MTIRRTCISLSLRVNIVQFIWTHINEPAVYTGPMYVIKGATPNFPIIHKLKPEEIRAYVRENVRDIIRLYAFLGPQRVTGL